jgi:polyisoprenoid-binding protein YceI
VNFTFTRFKTGKGPMGETRTGGEASFKIKRSDFGVTFMNGPVGDDVDLTVDLEAIQK